MCSPSFCANSSPKPSLPEHVVDHARIIVGEEKAVRSKLHDVHRPSVNFTTFKKAGDEILWRRFFRHLDDAITMRDADKARAVQRDEEVIFRARPARLKIFQAERRTVGNEGLPEGSSRPVKKERASRQKLKRAPS